MILKGKIYLFILTLFLFASCTATNYSSQSEKGTIIVRSGDTIYSIANRHNLSVRDLAEANNLQPPYGVVVGRKLMIPAIKYHIVQSGENLYQISRIYNVSVNKLIALNHLSKPYNIALGSKLVISNSAGSTSSNASKTTSTSKNTKTPVTPKTPKATPTIDPTNKRVEVTPKSDHEFIWPVNGTVISTFGQKTGGLYNDGINIKVAEGTPVKASEDGVVAYSGNELRGYGNLVIVKHSNDWISAYAHLSKAKVIVGDKVKKGTEIANVGTTGNVDFAQLYFGIRKGKDAVDPQKYLK